MLERGVKINGVYRHFKGTYYIVLDVATGCDDDNLYVVYRALYGDNKLYIRKLDLFLSLVDKEKYPDILQKCRYELVDNIK